MAAKQATIGGVLVLQCPDCRTSHAFKCVSRASRGSFQNKERHGPANSPFWGWITENCKHPEAVNGQLYVEFARPYPTYEEFPL